MLLCFHDTRNTLEKFLTILKEYNLFIQTMKTKFLTEKEHDKPENGYKYFFKY